MRGSGDDGGCGGEEGKCLWSGGGGFSRVVMCFRWLYSDGGAYVSSGGGLYSNDAEL